MSEKLNEIRSEIDKLDNKIHDLLMKRADLVSSIANEKKKNKLQVVQPGREAMMIRRLLERHEGPLPEAAVVRIWRELVGAVALLQTGLSVAVGAAENAIEYWDMAKNYFGSALPMQRVSTPIVAISAVCQDDVSFAVVPYPEEGEAQAWWPHLFSASNEALNVVCALPYGISKEKQSSGHAKAVILSKINFLPSGEDHSFIGLEIDQSVSRARIMEVLQSYNLEPLSLATKSGPGLDGYSQHFVEINNYLTTEDARLQEIAESFQGKKGRCLSFGGYPVTPVYHNQSVKPAITAPQVPERKSA